MSKWLPPSKTASRVPCRKSSSRRRQEPGISRLQTKLSKASIETDFTTTYSPLPHSPIQPRDTRQAQLQSSWGFTCTCSLCSAPDDETAASDQRTAQIHGLWQTLDDYGDAADGATPEEAEALVALYEAEGLETRVHEAHYRAAVEWNGVGDARNAVRYAMLSILRGQIMKGPERPFLSSMRELVKNPEEHWTWKFRLRESKSEKDL